MNNAKKIKLNLTRLSNDMIVTKLFTFVRLVFVLIVILTPKISSTTSNIDENIDETVLRWRLIDRSSSTIDFDKLNFIQTLKIRLLNKHTVQFSLNNDRHMFEFPRTNRTLDYREMEENMIEVCFRMLNSSSLTKATQFNHLSEFCQENFYNQLIRLDMSSNELKMIPSEILSRWFPRLEELDLSNNLIETITSASLKLLSRSSFKRLDLSLNKLEKLDYAVFKSLSTLRSLNLSMNQLKTINMFAFASEAHTLVDLDLSHNLITDQSMEFLVFSSFVSLRSLNMNYNRLSILSNHWFYNLYKLEYLSLSHNNLRSFDIVNFNSNEFLRVLDLSYNLNLQLDEEFSVPAVSQTSIANSSLELLNLAGVDLGHASDVFFEGLLEKLTRLKVLNLTSTRLKSFRPTSRWPVSIEIIDLSHNFIRDGQFECAYLLNRLINLEKVVLKYNRFKFFDGFIRSCSVFNRSGSIRFDLTFNLFESLNELVSANHSLKSCNSNILMFNLRENPLVCDCDENTWWSKIDKLTSEFRLATHKQTCLVIDDYEKLKCRSNPESSKQAVRKSWSEIELFSPIYHAEISPTLVCPYLNRCSSKTCTCCGFNSCECAFQCPAQCRCARDYRNTFDRVNCSSSELDVIPSNLPTTITDIYFNSNNLKRIQPYQFLGLNKITRIDFSHNNLAVIDENSFEGGLNNLRHLDLSFNELQFLLGYEFKDLVLLEILHLEYNR